MRLDGRLNVIVAVRCRRTTASDTLQNTGLSHEELWGVVQRVNFGLRLCSWTYQNHKTESKA